MIFIIVAGLFGAIQIIRIPSQKCAADKNLVLRWKVARKLRLQENRTQKHQNSFTCLFSIIKPKGLKRQSELRWILPLFKSWARPNAVYETSAWWNSMSFKQQVGTWSLVALTFMVV